MEIKVAKARERKQTRKVRAVVFRQELLGQWSNPKRKAADNRRAKKMAGESVGEVRYYSVALKPH